MTLSTNLLYFFTFSGALILSLILTPAARAAAMVLKILDHPITEIKTHKKPVPYLGGAAIYLAFTLTLLWVRVLTSFPTGTLRSLRGILIGGTFIFGLGLVDDIKHHGLHYSTKFFFQISAALMVILFDIRIKFIQPEWFGLLLTILWIVGLTNAFNLTDIMDGLASGIAVCASLAFFFISLPSEEIYVNFASIALAGAALGFMPYNLSNSMKIFMGDSGSLLLGFIASSLALGTSYGGKTSMVVFAPIMLLALPIYDTVFVSFIRMQKGQSPFVGSKDHFPLRLEYLGWSRKAILIFCLATTTLLAVGANIITRSEHLINLTVYGITILFFLALTTYILKAQTK